MLCEKSVCSRERVKVNIDGPLLVLLVGALGLDRLSGWHTSDRRHDVVDMEVKVCLWWWFECSTTKFPASVEKESGEWPFAYCRRVVVRVWKETEARGGKARKQR